MKRIKGYPPPVAQLVLLAEHFGSAAWPLAGSRRALGWGAMRPRATPKLVRPLTPPAARLRVAGRSGARAQEGPLATG
jgi:hypothetical protein